MKCRRQVFLDRDALIFRSAQNRLTQELRGGRFGASGAIEDYPSTNVRSSVFDSSHACWTSDEKETPCAFAVR